jgi:hypothetical protein
MSTQLEAAIIAGVVGLLTAAFGTAVTFLQAQRERSKWLVDFKTSYTIELYKQRLLTYPKIFTTIGRLSHGSNPKPNSSIAGEVASELNEWLYGTGGMCAEAGTRGAVLGLRLRCRSWADSGDNRRPADLYQWRNVALTMLRLDIDVIGLEQYDFDNMPSALQRLKKEVEQMVSGKSGAMSQSGVKRLDLRARPRTAGD